MKKNSSDKPAKASKIRCINPGRPRDLSTTVLNSGQPYQRPVKTAYVTKLVKRWNWLYFTPIIVSLRNGVYNVVLVPDLLTLNLLYEEKIQ